MSKAIVRAHIEQIWNNKDASGIERFIAPTYRGLDAEEVISGSAGYKQHFDIDANNGKGGMNLLATASTKIET